MIRSGSNYMLKWNLHLAILFSILSLCLHGQTPEQTFAYAILQSDQGNYSNSVKALNRLLFFDNGTHYPETFSLLANNYFHLKEYRNAYYYYDLAVIQSDNDSLCAEFTAAKIACRLYNHEFQEARVDLLSYGSRLSPDHQWQFDMLSGLTCFYLDEYELSKAFFLKCVNTTDAESRKAIEEGFARIEKLEKRYNPRLARALSIVVPGSGQMLAGDFLNGTNSFMLVFGLLATSVGLSSFISFIDAAIIVFPWFQRYYMGGYQKAYSLTFDKQKNEKNEVLAHLIVVLSTQENQ